MRGKSEVYAKYFVLQIQKPSHILVQSPKVLSRLQEDEGVTAHYKQRSAISCKITNLPLHASSLSKIPISHSFSTNPKPPISPKHKISHKRSSNLQTHYRFFIWVFDKSINGFFCRDHQTFLCFVCVLR